jgi:hypothetical protein
LGRILAGKKRRGPNSLGMDFYSQSADIYEKKIKGGRK